MSEGFADQSLSENAFLGGRLRILQPLKGYRAGVDPVLLAASIPAVRGQSVLELGCGSGVASLCLGARVANLDLNAIELQADYADLARRNSVLNGIDLKVETGDLLHLPDKIRMRQFDHVIANPPYFLRSKGSIAKDAGREVAMGEATPLADWIKIAAKRCAPKGYVSMIQRAERLGDMVAEFSQVLGGITVQPFVPRRGRRAQLVIVRGCVGGRGDFSLMDAIKMHRGRTHVKDAENYTKSIRSVLRDQAAINF